MRWNREMVTAACIVILSVAVLFLQWRTRQLEKAVVALAKESVSPTESLETIEISGNFMIKMDGYNVKAYKATLHLRR